MSMTAFTRAGSRTFAIACLTIASPALARTFNADQGNLTKTLNAMGPGDTVVLSPGGYGVVVVPRKSWQTPINVDARAASLTGVVMYKVAGVNWNGGTVIGTTYGVSIRASQRITVANMDISAAVRGIVINQGTDIKIQKNKMHNLRTDGVDIVGRNVLVENNTVTDMHPNAVDHPDGYQVWSTEEFISSDITIRNNVASGNMQGVFARAGGLRIDRLTVTGNQIATMWGNGIALLDSHDSVAKGNTVRRAPGSRWKANFRVEGKGNTACGNIAPDVPKAVAVQPCKG